MWKFLTALFTKKPKPLVYSAVEDGKILITQEGNPNTVTLYVWDIETIERFKEIELQMRKNK